MSRVRIWAMEGEPTPAKQVNLELSAGKMGGHFLLELLDGRTGEVLETRDFSNIVLDNWMNFCVTTGGGNAGPENMLTYIVPGSGSVTGPNTPATTDTTLNGEIAASRESGNGGFGDVKVFVTGSAPYWSLTRTRLWTESEANGTITEIGWSDSSTTGATIRVRTAVRDVTGTLAPIIKTNINQLRVTYEWRYYPPTNITTGSFSLLGNTYTYTIMPRTIDGTNWGSAGPFITSEVLGGDAAAMETITLPPAVSGTDYSQTNQVNVITARGILSASIWSGSMVVTGPPFYNDLQIDIEPGTAVFTTGIGGLVWSHCRTSFRVYQWMMQLSGSIMKNDLQRLQFYMRHTIDRATF
jgi:hypothetical protein